MVTTTYYKTTTTTRTPSVPSTTVTENGSSSLQQTQKSSVTATRRSARLSREGRYRKAAAAAEAVEEIEEMSRTSVRQAAALARVAITRSVQIKEECDDERSCYSDGMKKTSVECRGEAVSVVDRVLEDLRGDIIRRCREGSSSPSSEGRRGMKRRRMEVKEEEELPKRRTRNNRQGDLKGRLPFIPTPMRNDAHAPRWLKELQKTTDWYCDRVEC
ncbi:hypothetical protein FOZ60_017250 [Perkinsus olseni]|uniref:Uncharacterized protein n=1 Tax=Perkinsus olseni TaxID=32597 RepID=A0A7J6P410_PEROL|nr:hypothetical protein FOZ60_017250 [Perkinsus olseni]